MWSNEPFARNRHRKETLGPLEVEHLRLGRRPFQAGIEHFLKTKVAIWKGNSTMPTRRRDLYQMARQFEALKAEGRVHTTDPRHLKEDDIQAYLSRIKQLDPSRQQKLIRLLDSYLRFFRNRVIGDMIDRLDLTLPRASPKPTRFIELDDLRRIFGAAVKMPGWHGSICRGMAALYFATGVRPSELRLAEFQDLDMREGRERLYVRVPKGLGSWAAPEWVDLIREDVRPIIEHYLFERAEHLKECGRTEAKYLFPNLYRGRDSFFSANSWRKMRVELEEASGVDFETKDFRSSLATLTLRDDPSLLSAMSAQLRHANEDTTWRYYVNVDREEVGRRLRELCKEGNMFAGERGRQLK